jgi:ribonuclease P protein component
MDTVWSLRGAVGFSRVRSAGRSAKGREVSLRLVSTADGLPVRLGMAVGRSVGNAVERNLIRRRLRAIVGEVAGQLTGTLLLIRAFPGVLQVSFAELRTSVHTALGRVHPVIAP